MPFIGATESNNGITNWTSTVNTSLDRNVLGVNYNGSVVENFYHGYTCVFSDDVKRLHLKTAVDNKYVLLFFKTIILQQKKKYTYGYKFNENRMSRQKLLIPIDKDNSPDYTFMAAYMKEREEYLIRKYEHFLFERDKTIGGGGKKSYCMEVLLFDRNVPQNQTWKTSQAGRPHPRNYAVCLFFKRYQRYRRIHLEQQWCPNLCKLPNDSEQRECRFVSLSSLSFRRKRSCNESA